MMMSPSEDVTPVRKVIRGHRKSVSPRFHNRFHIVQRVVTTNVGRLQALMNLMKTNSCHQLTFRSSLSNQQALSEVHKYLSCFLQFNYLLGSLQKRSVDMGYDPRDALPFLKKTSNITLTSFIMQNLTNFLHIKNNEKRYFMTSKK